MLHFYYRESGRFTEWVTEKLEEMVVAHKTVEVNGSESLPEAISKRDLPVLCDEHDVWTTEDEISTFLEDLHQQIAIGRGMQSDACHIDPDNPEECL